MCPNKRMVQLVTPDISMSMELLAVTLWRRDHLSIIASCRKEHWMFWSDSMDVIYLVHEQNKSFKSCWWNRSLDTFWQRRIQLICWRGDLVSKLSMKKKCGVKGDHFWSITCQTGQGWKCKLKETQTATSRNCSKNRYLFVQLWSNA